jgi:hypothetical protein
MQQACHAAFRKTSMTAAAYQVKIYSLLRGVEYKYESMVYRFYEHGFIFMPET